MGDVLYRGRVQQLAQLRAVGLLVAGMGCGVTKDVGRRWPWVWDVWVLCEMRIVTIKLCCMESGVSDRASALLVLEILEGGEGSDGRVFVARMVGGHCWMKRALVANSQPTNMAIPNPVTLLT